MVTASEWEEREQRAGQSGLLYGHWSMCSELLKMYRNYCFTANLKTLFGTSLMALGAGQRQGDFSLGLVPYIWYTL